jgi:dienelactone hydrolase
LCAAIFFAAYSANAVDIKKCSMVADGSAEIITFGAQQDNGKRATLKGILAGPAGAGPFPVIVILPGGQGLYTPYCYGAWVDKFKSWGYATLIVASSTAHDGGGNRLPQYSFVDQANHALGAASALAKMPKVDLTRIGVWGFSLGGLTAIELATRPWKGSNRFRVIIAASPHCPATVLTPHTPLFVLIGAEDATAPLSACIDFAAQLERAKGFEFLLMPGARHFFWMNAAAADLSAQRIQAFLTKHF